MTLQPQRGNPLPVEVTVAPIRSGSDTITGLRWLVRDISERVRLEAKRKQAEAHLEMQSAILERIARADPLPDILEHLLHAMEEQLPGALCSVMLREGDRLYSMVAPQLPDGYLQAVNGIAIAEGAGSCGTAAFRQDAVIVADIATDPLWQNFKALGQEYGLGACWSIPIWASDGRVLGTFAIYHRDRYTPSAPEQVVAGRAAHIAGIAIEREQATQSLRQLNQDLERRVAERTEALQTSEERWQLVLRGTNDGIWDWDLQTNKVFFSSRWKQMRGFMDAEISDSPEECLKRIHPEDYDRLMAAVDDHLAGRTEFFEIEYRAQRRDGSYMWVLDRAQAVWNAAGQAIRISGSEKDISDRKAIEKQLQLTQHSVDNAAEGILWINPDFSFFYANRAACQMLGYSQEELLQLRIPDIDPDFVPDALDAFWEEEGYDSTQFVLESRHRAKDGRVYPVEIVGNFHRLDGRRVKFVRVLDISDRKRMEAALAESEAKFRRLVEGGSDLIWEKDNEGRFTYLSPQFQTLFGWEPQDWIGKSFLEVVHPDDLPWMTVGYRQDIASGKKSYPEFRHRHRDGHYVWVRGGATPILDAAGVVISKQGILTDISDRKRMEAELAESEAKFRQLVEGMNDLIWSCGQDGRLTYLSPQFQTLFGWEPQEWIGKLFNDLIHPDDLATLIAHSSSVQSGQRLYQHPEFRHRHRDGHYIWVQASAKPMFNAEGALIGTQGILTDISDRKCMEAALAESEAKFRRLVEDMSDVIWAQDAEGRFTYLSPQFQTLFGWEPQDWIDQSFLGLVHPDDQPWLVAEYQRYLELRHSQKSCPEFRHLHRDGHYSWVRVSATLRLNAEGVVIGTQGVLVDISDRKRAEIRLQQQANRDRLISAISQHIRASLNLQEILNATVTEVRQVLQTDRVLVYRLYQMRPA
jgi:PAS domain S-box-containing protein